jgi:hypothetical protein
MDGRTISATNPLRENAMPSIIVYFNTHPNHFMGYEHGHPLEKAFNYEAPTTSGLFRLAAKAFQAFNAPLEFVLPAYRPAAEAYRATGLRSLPVGVGRACGDNWLACAATSWIALAEAPSELFR